MTSSRPERIDVRHLTSKQPFYAGVILLDRGSLLVTLTNAGIPSTLTKEKGTIYKVGGVSTGQKPGETIWECATRAARDLLSTDAQLLTSPHTYFHDIDSGEVYRVDCTDTVAPFLLERQSNLYPYTPYRLGLPTGPFTYFALFTALVTQSQFQLESTPIQGFLRIPLALWPLLSQQPTLETLLQQGTQLIANTALPHNQHIWIHPDEPLSIVATLLQKHPELASNHYIL